MDRNYRKTLLKALIKKILEPKSSGNENSEEMLPNNKIQYVSPQDRGSNNSGFMTIPEMAAGTPNIF